MFVFETHLKKIKHEVLKQIAILAMKDELTTDSLSQIHHHIVDKDKPKYRCCVFKERAIVNHRAKLAAGFLPVGENNSELIDIKKSSQIIYVVEAACDNCPIDRYTVTEACRGCVAHKCREVCPANAMTSVGGRAYINQELCKECGLCKKACPYDAISDVVRPCKTVCPTGALSVNPDNRQAMIKNDLCVQCGSCMSACPFGAISDKSLIAPVSRRLKKNDLEMIAVVAPSIAGQFGPNVSLGQIQSALKNIGFKSMIEVSCGADLVTINESNEFVERMDNGDRLMTSSCCPGFYSYMEKKFPEDVKFASSTVSPMVALGRLIKKQSENNKIVFIGPCTAKKAEIRRPELKGAIDYVLTFEELSALLDAFNMDPELCEDSLVDDGSVFGRGFGMAGGLTAAIENYIKTENIDIDFKPIKVSGPDDVKKVLTLAKVNKLPGNFIEGMMCQGGCINGAGTILPPLSTKNSFIKENKQSSKENIIDNDKKHLMKDINMHR